MLDVLKYQYEIDHTRGKGHQRWVESACTWSEISPSDNFQLYVYITWHLPFFFYLPLERVLLAVTLFSPVEESIITRVETSSLEWHST